ncbi:hypothetical protein K1719_026379 [Acacia pycnantha]|nr:hypothetical protein K1719_026379 [Acacia pycnantha]
MARLKAIGFHRLVSMLGQEMMALQDRLTTSPNNQPSSSGECEEDDDDRDEEDDDKEIDDEGDEKEIEDEDDDNDKEKDDQDDEKEIEDEDDEKDKEDEDDHIVDIDDEDSHLHDTPIQGERSDGKIRRSKRVITRSSVLKSPWIDPNRKTKGKRQYDEKEQLYELCTTKSIPKDEAEEEFVDMNGWHLQRVELLCLRPRTWINNTVWPVHFCHELVQFDKVWL